MLFAKSCRFALALAAGTALSQVADAGCNCGVPPSPGVSAGVAQSAPWSGTPYYANSPGSMAATAYGTMPTNVADYDTAGPHWAPGGYEPRIGSPAYYYDPSGGQYVVTGDPYYDHFGPGFQRHSLHGHYRFPYYNYRAPWYFTGRAVYNRNTNMPW